MAFDFDLVVVVAEHPGEKDSEAIADFIEQAELAIASPRGLWVGWRIYRSPALCTFELCTPDGKTHKRSGATPSEAYRSISGDLGW